MHRYHHRRRRQSVTSAPVTGLRNTCRRFTQALLLFFVNLLILRLEFVPGVQSFPAVHPHFKSADIREGVRHWFVRISRIDRAASCNHRQACILADRGIQITGRMY